MHFDNESGILLFTEGIPAGLTTVVIKYWKYEGKTLKDGLDTDGPQLNDFQIFIGATGVTAIDSTNVKLNHALDADNLIWKMTVGGNLLYPENIIKLDKDNIQITLDPIPVSDDNVAIHLTKLA